MNRGKYIGNPIPKSSTMHIYAQRLNSIAKANRHYTEVKEMQTKRKKKEDDKPNIQTKAPTTPIPEPSTSIFRSIASSGPSNGARTRTSTYRHTNPP
jgi:hypothetical protein